MTCLKALFHTACCLMTLLFVVPLSAADRCTSGPAGPHDVDYLTACRPQPVGAAERDAFVRTLPSDGALTTFTPAQRTKIEAMQAVLRLHGRLLSPALTNPRVDWGALDVTQAPSAVPPVFAGGRLLLYGFLRGEPAVTTTATVRLTADTPRGPVAFDTEVDFADMKAGTTIATLAARARIRELEESPAWTRARGSRQRRPATATREIVELSLRYGLVSRETSYVAVERRETPVLGDVQLRRVPIALTTGWGAFPGTSCICTPR